MKYLLALIALALTTPAAADPSILRCKENVFDGKSHLYQTSYYKVGENSFYMYDSNSGAWSGNLCNTHNYQCNMNENSYQYEYNIIYGSNLSEGGSFTFNRKTGEIHAGYGSSVTNLGARTEGKCSVADDPAHSRAPNKF